MVRLTPYEAIEELKKVDTLDMPARLCEAHYMSIKALEQEPKTGYWTYICNSEVNGLKIVECSECGKRTYGSGNYCPNCGCRMVDPHESEEV